MLHMLRRYCRYALCLWLLPLLALAQPLKVCAEAWPPFLYRDDRGEVSGMAAGWINRAAGQVGLQPQYQFLSLPACRKLAAAGVVDVLAFTPSSEQLEGWLFTREPMVFWVLNAFVPPGGRRAAWINFIASITTLRWKPYWPPASSKGPRHARRHTVCAGNLRGKTKMAGTLSLCPAAGRYCLLARCRFTHG